MAGEYSSGIRFKEGDVIKGYRIVKALDSGAFAFPAKAVNERGREVFFKKYKKPGGSATWYREFVQYQDELKRRIETYQPARLLCYEFVEFFQLERPSSGAPMRAFYQVFEWIEGGYELRHVLDQLKSNPREYSWNQRVIFARVMMAGIRALHEAKVVHSDLKPENLYLVPDPNIAAKFKLRIIDLDYAVLEGVRVPWDGVEGYVGTPGYMSPEHLNHRAPCRASDVFTSALIISELLGDGHPGSGDIDHYEDKVLGGRLAQIRVSQPIAEVQDLDFLNHVLNGALRVEPDRRPSALQLLQALNGQLPSWDGRMPRTSGRFPPIVPSPTPGTGVPVTPPAPPATPTPIGTPLSILEVRGPAGQTVSFKIGAQLGQGSFRGWGEEFTRFMASSQFRVFKNGAGQWMVEHASGALNYTCVNGERLVSPVAIQSGMKITVGQSQRCPVTLHLTGR
jgi:eukaryotic-like serine/threonine-protein kinase